MNQTSELANCACPVKRKNSSGTNLASVGVRLSQAIDAADLRFIGGTTIATSCWSLKRIRLAKCFKVARAHTKRRDQATAAPTPQTTVWQLRAPTTCYYSQRNEAAQCNFAYKGPESALPTNADCIAALEQSDVATASMEAMQYPRPLEFS